MRFKLAGTLTIITIQIALPSIVVAVAVLNAKVERIVMVIKLILFGLSEHLSHLIFDSLITMINI